MSCHYIQVIVTDMWDLLSFREDVGKPHWYPTVFDNDFVQNFLRMFIEPYHQKEDNEQDMFESKSFTLTVAIPSESGPLHGWEIRALKIPGR